MKIYFNSLGVVTNFETEQADSLRQGSVGNKITAIFDGIIVSDCVPTLNFTRSDGSIISNVGMDIVDANKCELVFDDPWYFALAGNATMTIFLHDGSGNVVAQGQHLIAIESSDYDPSAVPPITQEEYDYLLAQLASKLNKSGVTQLGESMSWYDGGIEVFSYENGAFTFHLPVSFTSLDAQAITINGQAAATEAYVQSELIPYATEAYVQEQISAIVLTPYETKVDATAKYNELNGKINDVRNVAEGKSKSYTISVNNNAAFNTQDSSISGVLSITDISGNTIQVSSLKNGDVVLIIEIDKPDRWYSASDGKFYVLETAKVDLSPYVKKVDALPMFSIGANVKVRDFVVEKDLDNKMFVFKSTSDEVKLLLVRLGQYVDSFSMLVLSPLTSYAGPLPSNATFDGLQSAATETIYAESKTNMTYTIDSSSGLTQYPSAKAVYNFVTSWVTAQDKTNWNGKSVVSGSGTGTSTTPITYITIDGVEYVITPQAAAAIPWGNITGNLADQTDLKNALDAKQAVLTFDSTPTQNSSNPVTSGGVYAECKNIREVAEGKCKTIVISYNATPVNQNTYDHYSKADGTPFNGFQDFEEYTNQYECGNGYFNSQSDYIDVASVYLITTDEKIIVPESDIMKDGDIILVIETDVPDRWLNWASDEAYKLETAKVEVGTTLYKHVMTVYANTLPLTFTLINLDSTPITYLSALDIALKDRISAFIGTTQKSQIVSNSFSSGELSIGYVASNGASQTLTFTSMDAADTVTKL